MPRWQARLTIGRMMGVVALVALGRAVLRWDIWALLLAYMVGRVGVMAGATLGVAKGAGIARGRAAAWVCAAHPWMVLGLLYLGVPLDWYRRAHLVGVALPRSHPFALIDGAFKLTSVLLIVGLPLDWLASLVLAIGQGIEAAERGEADRGDRVTRAILIPLFLWLGALVVFAADNARLIRWLVL